MFCRNCGKTIEEDYAACPYCGTAVKVEEKKTLVKQYYVSAKSKKTATCLALLGLLFIAGLHRIYVGKKISGYIYAFTFGIFFLGTLYDLYSIYSETFKDGEGYPLYSDESMQTNYHRRELKQEVSFLYYILPVLFGGYFFCGQLYLSPQPIHTLGTMLLIYIVGGVVMFILEKTTNGRRGLNIR